MKKIAVLQSNYIPWKGYFDIIALADEFVIYDEVQFTTSDWRNRNKIKTAQGSLWLTVPVGRSISRKIKDVEITNTQWQRKHWISIEQSYKKAPFFEEISQWLRPILYENSYTYLTELNVILIKTICDYLGINTKISYSWDYELIGDKTDRLINLCHQTSAKIYISGPSAKDYIDLTKFEDADITVVWADYSGYPDYPQLWGEFCHELTILDLLFNCGKNSFKYMKYLVNNDSI